MGMTRAKIALTLSYAQTRYRWGAVSSHSPSRFLKEIDARWIQQTFESNQSTSFENHSANSFASWHSVSAGEKRIESYGSRQSVPFVSNHSKSKVLKSSIPKESSLMSSINRPSRSTFLSPLPDTLFSPDDPLHFRTGQIVEHERFGRGTILSMEGKNRADLKAMVHFDAGGVKTLLLMYARMRIVGDQRI